MDSYLHRVTTTELRRAYESFMELSVSSTPTTAQPLEEYKQMYLQAFQAYQRGEMQNAELLARAVRHLCRASWYDAKIKHLESHAEAVPHVVGLSDEMYGSMQQGMNEVKNRLSRLKLTGLADRYGGRARKHLERIATLPDHNSMLAHSFFTAGYEYCLATEFLHELEFKAAA